MFDINDKKLLPIFNKLRKSLFDHLSNEIDNFLKNNTNSDELHYLLVSSVFWALISHYPKRFFSPETPAHVFEHYIDNICEWAKKELRGFK